MGGVNEQALAELLTEEFRAQTANKTYFPISALRERCRRHLKNSALQKVERLTFYRAFSDAVVSAMIASSIAETAQVGRGLYAALRDLDGREPGGGLLLRLHYIAGLSWDEIGEFHDRAGQAAMDLARELKMAGLSEEVLQRQNLRPRGDVTQLLENVRDGQRPLGDVIASQQGKLQRHAAHLLKLEGGNISLQSGDLVNEMFLRMPQDSSKAPANHMEFEALAKRIMRHILIDRSRKSIPGHGRLGAALSENLITPADRTEDRLLLEKTLEVVESVLKELRQTDHEAAEMLHAILFRGADQKELARLHGISVSTVKRRVKDARDRVRGRLGLE
jgi:RNA polymerase sigma factor (sigma-70 family)